MQAKLRQIYLDATQTKALTPAVTKPWTGLNDLNKLSLVVYQWINEKGHKGIFEKQQTRAELISVNVQTFRSL